MQNDYHHQYVTFVLNQESYGIAVTQTREILDSAVITKVPQTSAEMLGVINLRGQVVPVIDMHLKLGLPVEGESRDSCIIIVEVNVDDEVLVVGVQVDEVREVLDLSKEAIEPPPRLGTKLNAWFIKGMGKIDDKFIVLLDIDHLFGEAELQEVQSLGSEEEVLTGEMAEV